MELKELKVSGDVFPLTVGDVVRYMYALKSGMDRGQRTSIGKATASVLKFYSQGDLAESVNVHDFTSKRGAGLRAYHEFLIRHEELKGMREFWKGKVESEKER